MSINNLIIAQTAAWRRAGAGLKPGEARALALRDVMLMVDQKMAVQPGNREANYERTNLAASKLSESFQSLAQRPEYLSAMSRLRGRERRS